LAKEEAEKIIAEFGGEVVGYDYPVNFFQARFPGEGEAFEKTRINLLSRKGVEMVTPTPVSVHKDPYYVR
ncbi:MAG: hypothetical protein OEZ04_13250, partial [Nitrospinota bacterium]|nr:hypothetical protein [Nitrospinota bacterium]